MEEREYDIGSERIMSVAEYLVDMMQISFSANRFDDMRSYAKKLVATNSGILQICELRLVLESYNQSVAVERTGLRFLVAIQRRPDWFLFKYKQRRLMREYQRRIKKRIFGLAQECVNIIENEILPATEESHILVNCHKALGDYFRYMAEAVSPAMCVAENVENSDDNGPLDNMLFRLTCEKSLGAYGFATETAQKCLCPSHHDFISIAINLSSLYELMGDFSRSKEVLVESKQAALAVLPTAGINDPHEGSNKSPDGNGASVTRTNSAGNKDVVLNPTEQMLSLLDDNLNAWSIAA